MIDQVPSGCTKTTQERYNQRQSHEEMELRVCPPQMFTQVTKTALIDTITEADDLFRIIVAHVYLS